MKLTDAIKLESLRADGSTGEWFELYYGMQPLPTFRPPSLRNGRPVVADMPTDGYHPRDSPALKKRAKEDMVEILKRMRRQTGKPEITQGALYPLFPNIAKWM